jgi:hypothetical protein
LSRKELKAFKAAFFTTMLGQGSQTDSVSFGIKVSMSTKGAPMSSLAVHKTGKEIHSAAPDRGSLTALRAPGMTLRASLGSISLLSCGNVPRKARFPSSIRKFMAC